jgi:subtilisin-like proprotein convertase family protein
MMGGCTWGRPYETFKRDICDALREWRNDQGKRCDNLPLGSPERAACEAAYQSKNAELTKLKIELLAAYQDCDEKVFRRILESVDKVLGVAVETLIKTSLASATGAGGQTGTLTQAVDVGGGVYNIQPGSIAFYQLSTGGSGSIQVQGTYSLALAPDGMGGQVGTVPAMNIQLLYPTGQVHVRRRGTLAQSEVRLDPTGVGTMDVLVDAFDPDEPINPMATWWIHLPLRQIGPQMMMDTLGLQSADIMFSMRESVPGDCDGDGMSDLDEIAGGKPDCNGNGIPDECEIGGDDCNGNNVLDACEYASGVLHDLNGNGLPDECESLVFTPASPLEIPKPVNDNVVTTSTIFVPPGTPTLTGLSVVLDINHTFNGDLDILLIRNGQYMVLSTDNGGGGDNIANLRLRQSAPSLVTTMSGNNVVAELRPEGTVGTFSTQGLGLAFEQNDLLARGLPNVAAVNSLDAWNGTDPSGPWTLWIADDASGDFGSLQYWSLELNGDTDPTGPPPPPPPPPAFAGSFVATPNTLACDSPASGRTTWSGPVGAQPGISDGAGELALGTRYAGVTLDNAGNEVGYRILHPGGDLAATLTGLSTDLDLFLLGPAGTPASALDSSTAGGTTSESVLLAAAPAGIYFLVVDTFGTTNAGSNYVITYTCPPAPCDPDANADGNVNQDDVDYLINVIGGGDNPSGYDPDFNGDGNANQDDVDALINVVAGGDCP